MRLIVIDDHLRRKLNFFGGSLLCLLLLCAGLASWSTGPHPGHIVGPVHVTEAYRNAWDGIPIGRDGLIHDDGGGLLDTTSVGTDCDNGAGDGAASSLELHCSDSHRLYLRDRVRAFFVWYYRSPITNVTSLSLRIQARAPPLILLSV